MIIKLLNLLILLIVPFLMAGIIRRTKAFWAGRKGAPILQPLYDFLRLLKKEFVISTTTSTVFKITPIIVIVATFFAALFVPLCNGEAMINIPCGFIIFSYILGLGKFMSLISSMDTGSSFEGMGASREACFSTIVEPAFFITLASIMLVTQNYTFDSLNEMILSSSNYGVLIIAFTVFILFLMILVEGSRVPVDDPTTHLELTMIHEVMILDNSALDLAFLTWANSIKMLLFSSLIAAIIIPSGLSLIASIGLYLLILFIISIAIGTLESAMARIRMSHVFEFIFVLNSLALVVLSLAVASGFGG